MNGTIAPHQTHPSHESDRDRCADAIFPDLRPADQEKLQEYKAAGAQIDDRRARRLGWFSVASIIANRMIGTGIFVTPTTILQRDHNIGASLMLWLAGCVASLAGSLVYVEYGLTIPRWIFEDGTVCAPRSGGELNYLQYLIQKPRFLASCLFGIPFFLIGNSAQNALSFAYHFLHAIGASQSKLNLQLVAISAALITCITHSLWRRFGIYLNNIFASIKVLMLLLIISLGVRSFKQDSGGDVECSPKSTAATKTINLKYDNSFHRLGDAVGSSGYATAYLQIIFSFSGLNQANYVLNQNVLQNCESKDWSVGREFFKHTLGSVKTYSAFLTVSSFGNIIVTTFTAARVKQEIAKSGILPWAKLIAEDRDPLRRFKQRRQPNHETPAMALALHFLFTVIILLTTLGIDEAQEGYTTLLSIYSYAIDAFFAACLGLGLIAMRTLPHLKHHMFDGPNKRREDWNMASVVPWQISIVAGTLMFISNTYPLVASWIPANYVELHVPWYVVPTSACSVLASGIIYYLGMKFIWSNGRDRVVVRDLMFSRERDNNGQPVQAVEAFDAYWVVPPPSNMPRHSSEYDVDSIGT
ncbi:High-affinity methionine permease [Diplodia seriata]|uniref:High-affinity methionine permease n=1 Tax=Diplodia seriata TaxID=420778 RepID=A0A1S8B447_9PEZI|nr:High-affinity methionine permease [Diplodia seriata]